MGDGGIPHCDHCVKKIIHTKRVLGHSARQIHKSLADLNISMSYSAVLTALKKDVKEEQGDSIPYRSYVLGDRTDEVMAIVKTFFEEEDEEGDTTEQDCIDYLEKEHAIQISRCVLRNIKHAAGLKCYPEITVPDISPQQALKRFLFVHEMIEKKETFVDWIWTDESIIQIGSNRRFITSTTQYDKRRLQGVRKFPKKVMIWAAITWDGPGPIAFLERGETLDAPAYIGILEDFLLPFIDNWKGRGHRNSVVFQQDGASCHTARYTMDKFTEWGVKIAPWAPSSPDCNPIEYVWRDMKYWVRKNRKPKNEQEIREAALFYWQNVLTKDRCRSYITHVKDNMSHIHRVNGGPIVDKWKLNN